MLWVIFPIPDPVTSFKKIHVPIRLAHRHSFNEQINHSDGYNSVITGFKYDNLHPNGAAKPWLRGKKVGRFGESFILFSIWNKAGHRKPWVTQKGRFGKVIIIQLQQLFQGKSHLLGPLSTCWHVQLWCREIFSDFLGQTAFALEFYSQPSLVRKGVRRELSNESSLEIKLTLVKPDPYWSKSSLKEVWEGRKSFQFDDYLFT